MKRILCVADEAGWIFDYHCKQIQKRLPEFHIDIAYRKQNIVEMSHKYDLVYILDPIPVRYPDKSKVILGFRADFLYLDHPQGAFGAYNYGMSGRCAYIKNNCCMMHVVNRNQFREFAKVADIPVFLSQHGVDIDLFDRNEYKKDRNDVLNVSVSGRHSNNKGFEIVAEACKIAGVNVIAAQYGRRKLTKEQMPLLYNKADVHVCMSKNEGLNNPILEAGAMGLPVISTRCGAIEEMVIDGESGLIIDRDVNSLVEALNKLKDDDVRLSMGIKFYDEIVKNWSWDVRIEDFRNMFNYYFDMLCKN